MSGPVLIDLDKEDAATAAMNPAEAPTVPDLDERNPHGTGFQRAATLGSGRRSRLILWFLGVLGAFLGFALSLAAWDFVTGLLARNPVLGAVATALLALLGLIALLIAFRELASIARLRRVDGLRAGVEQALAQDDVAMAAAAADRIMRHYRGRQETRWGRDRFQDLRGDIFDAGALMTLAEQEVIVPLDQAAIAEVETASRQVATVTALVPLALADLITALSANLRMIRRIAEIYGGRAGTLGSLRLIRGVLAHLVATGALAIGDDLIGSVAGGSVLSKLSRRFGEGIINGALTARVGIAAIEVCRPMPFRAAQRPSATALVGRALKGLFGA